MSGALTPESLRRAQDRALGWSIPLVPVEPSLGPAAGVDVDLSAGARVSGEDALAQAIELALITLRGSDVFNVAFGFRGMSAIAEEVDPILKRERLRMAMIEVLKDEPRIRRILAVRFEDELGDGERAAPSRTPPPRSLAIEAEIETGAGERMALVLGGEALDVR